MRMPKVESVRLILQSLLVLMLVVGLAMSLAEYLGGVAEYRDWLWFCH